MRSRTITPLLSLFSVPVFSVPLLSVLLVLALFLFDSGHASAAIFVTSDGSGSNDGSSWNNATTLQNALSTATAGDEIWIAQGIYMPGEAVTGTFLLPAGVALYGGFAGTESARDQRNWRSHLTI